MALDTVFPRCRLCSIMVEKADNGEGSSPSELFAVRKAAGQKRKQRPTGNLEDVPFDLRHLRIMIYDIRDPGWGEKLKKNIAAYLRSTRKEPEKSIPQPFRGLRGPDEADSDPLDVAINRQGLGS